MHTLQPTLRLGRDVWDRTAMPVEEFLERANRLRAAMGRAGLDALLLYGSGLNLCGHPTYLSHYIVKLPFSALVVLPREGEPALMFEGATRGRAAAQATTWIEDVRPCWNMAETCLAVLEERTLTASTIGLAAMPRLVPHAEWAALVAGLSRARLVDAEALVDGQRAVKSSREIGQVRRASHIVGRALDELPAVDESRLAAHVIRAARLMGAEDIRVMVARPDDPGWAFRPPEPRPLHAGESLAVTCGASWERYWSEATRTFVARGERLEPFMDDEIASRFQAMAARAAAGTPVADWVRAARSAMTPAERGLIAPYGLGHGIGVTPEEWPVLSADSGATIASGMCLVLRTAVSTGEGLALHADTVIVE